MRCFLPCCTRTRKESFFVLEKPRPARWMGLVPGGNEARYLPQSASPSMSATKTAVGPRSRTRTRESWTVRANGGEEIHAGASVWVRCGA